MDNVSSNHFQNDFNMPKTTKGLMGEQLVPMGESLEERGKMVEGL